MKKFMIALLISLFAVSLSFAAPPDHAGPPDDDDRGKCWTKKVKGDCPPEPDPPDLSECLPGWIDPDGPCAIGS